MKSVLAVTLAAAMCPAVPVAAAADEVGGGSASEALSLTSDASGAPIVNWTAWGTCEWMIDSAGGLVVRPANGAAEGYVTSVYSWEIPWKDKLSSIKSVRFEGKCHIEKENTWSEIACNGWFKDCSSLNTVDLSGLDTSSVTDMSYMFYGCSSLASLDLSSLNTSAVTDMSYMFYDCSKLSSLELASWDTSAVTDMGGMFHGCSALASLDLSSLNTSAVTDMSYMFYDCSKLSSLGLASWDTSAVADMDGMFHGCSALASLDLSRWNTSAVTDMSSMFSDCSKLSSIDLSGFNTSSVTKMWGMFLNCSNLSTVDVASWDTSVVTNMWGMFDGCSALASLDLSRWNTSTVTDTSSMFDGCSALASLDLSHWDTSTVTNMEWMFYGCSALSSLNLSGWDTSTVTDMGGMFNSCESLQTVSLGQKFAFKDGKYTPCVLPTPSGSGLTGKWLSSADGKAYAASEVPSNVAATYTAESTVTPNPAPEPTPTPDPDPTPAPDSEPTPTFPDVDYSQWYADGVTFCAEKGLITGYTSGDDAGKFGVGRTLTRAQLAAILWRNAEPEAAEAYDSDASNVTGMADVADNEWYTGAANWAVKNEVINGFGGVEFRPNAAVTAEQLATILANYADRTGAENADLGLLSGFADSDAISDWARGSVAWAKSKDIINGYDEGGARYLKPYEEIARERVATILMNAFKSGVLK